MNRVTVKFVPRLMSEDQNKNCVDVSKELVDPANSDESFLKSKSLQY
jgi:hypothetical protein